MNVLVVDVGGTHVKILATMKETTNLGQALDSKKETHV